MAGSRNAQPEGFVDPARPVPPRTPGPMGLNDGLDPFLWWDGSLGDSPGPLGLNDGTERLSNGALPVDSADGASSDPLTPIEFADLYHNTRVSFIDPASNLAQSVVVDVHVYNNNGVPRYRGNLREKDAIVSRIRRELNRAGGLGLIDVERSHIQKVAHSFFGKGFPGDYAIALHHALRYGRTTPGGMQNYCDNTARLGLDCSGFTNAYFLTVGRIESSRTISVYERGPQRQQSSGVKDLDVLIWPGSSGRRPTHIAVIDHVVRGSDPLQMVVVESAASKHGLTTSDYTVLEVRNGLFHVDRGGPGTNRSWVKCVAVS